MYNQPYTDEQIAFIRNFCSEMTASDFTVFFNETFKENRTKKGLQGFISSLGLRCVRTKNTWTDSFTSEQKEFLLQYGSQMSRKELTDLFNKHFHEERPLSTIKGFCNRNNIPSPNGNGQYTSETSPRWQKGLSKEDFKSHYTEQSFKDMTSPMIESNIKHSIGDEVIRHGLPYIVVNNDFGHGFDKRLCPKDVYVWEQHNGPIPKTHMLIHLDNDPMNCDISNLRCIPRKYRAFFRHNNWWRSESQVKDTAIDWCKLYYLLKETFEG